MERLVEVERQADSTQSELTEFKKDEKIYGIKTDKQLRSLDNMHWKVLGVGIALLGVGLTAYKIFFPAKEIVKVIT